MASITLIPNGVKYSCGPLSGEIAFHVKQYPEMLDDKEYGCCFLASQYFTAENDYFRVNLKDSDGNKEVLGWVFHINLLTEEEDFYIDLNDYLLKHLHVGFHKLIEYSIGEGFLKNEKGTLDDLGLSDDLIILVYRLSKCKEVDIIKLLPSLYNNGFVLAEDPKTVDSSKYRVNQYLKERIDDFKSDSSRNCINLCKESSVFDDNIYIKSLFITYLPSIDDPYLRYLMSYQIIEILMSIEYSNKYYEYVIKFGNEKRHNLMDKFGELSSESRLINKIFEIGAHSSLHKDFVAFAKALIDSLGEDDFKENPEFPDYMYKIRNLVVHNLSVMRDYPNEMERIADIYELVIADIIHRTTITMKQDKRLFVIDMNMSYKENRKLFYEAYH